MNNAAVVVVAVVVWMQWLFLFQSYLVADTYDRRNITTWVEPLFQIVVLKGDFKYLAQYQSLFQLTPTIMAEVVARCVSTHTNAI